MQRTDRRPARHRARAKWTATNRRWNLPRGKRVYFWQRLNPSQLFVLSFVGLILMGTWGLMGLPGLYQGQPLGWLDALFTATSAACVTGLTVVDTGTYFTAWGQVYLLILIQLGGLGMMTLTSMIIATLGGRLSLRTEAATVGYNQIGPYVGARRLVLDVLRFTVVIELSGALLLYLLWSRDMGHARAAWHGLFHSVSAFCNAGFSTFNTSMIEYRHSPATTTTIMLLIVLGGLGFLTLEELYVSRARRTRATQVRRPISIHTQLVLYMTFLLSLLGGLAFLAFEWNGTLQTLAWQDKLHNALFMSITARTAGFSVIDYGQASDSTNFITILLMMIGGAPGSTAGGMKTTTFALLGLLAWARIRGRSSTTFASRSIPDETIQRAVGLFVIVTGTVMLGVLLMTCTQPVSQKLQPFLSAAFEVASAFNTVGLSMGVTPELTTSGRWLAIVLMFLGRVGPLALASAFIVRRGRVVAFRYAYEDVIVG
ncbi:MAG: TrkH family potassium uptake protein [Pirellulaceae bacterium]|nr:TrkH family potassium uptake protein [Pirellulaceae bacterium]